MAHSQYCPVLTKKKLLVFGFDLRYSNSVTKVPTGYDDGKIKFIKSASDAINRNDEYSFSGQILNFCNFGYQVYLKYERYHHWKLSYVIGI